MSWESFKLPKWSGSLSDALSKIDSLNNLVLNAFKAAKSVAEVIQKVTINTDKVQLALRAVAVGLKSALDALLQDFPAAYILLVPPSPKTLIPTSVKLALGSVTPQLPSSLLNVSSQFTPAELTPEVNTFIRQVFEASTGNGAFVKAVLDSLADNGDDSRPTLADDSYVAGAYIVAGAKGIELLTPFLDGLTSLLLSQGPHSIFPVDWPAPQGLVVKGVNTSTVSVRWTRPGLSQPLPRLDTFCRVVGIAIVRSESPSLMEAQTAAAIFGTNTLTEGMTGVGGAKVIKILDIAEAIDIVDFYIDNGTFDKGKAYYYTIAYRYLSGTALAVAVNDTSMGAYDHGFGRCSNGAKVHFSAADKLSPRSSTGTPPDWIRSPRAIDLFPVLGQMFTTAGEYADQLLQTTQGYGSLLDGYVKQLDNLITQYTATEQAFRDLLAQLDAIASIDLGEVSIRGFSGTGGTVFLQTDIIKAFTESGAPQFNDDSFVTGVVLLGTTPSFAAFISLLVGGPASTKIEDALAQIDVQVAAVETSTFSDSMVAGGTPTTLPVYAGTPAIGPAGAYCYHPYESSVTLGDNFQPRS